MSIRTSNLQKVAQGLGWFSVGLGLLEVLRPRDTARAAGMKDRPALIQAYGLREIATGIGLLTFKDPTPWLWARVVGDVVDVATVGADIERGTPAAKRAIWSLVGLAGVLALDAAVAVTSTKKVAQENQPVFDYSDRSGWPGTPDEMRGKATIH